MSLLEDFRLPETFSKISRFLDHFSGRSRLFTKTLVIIGGLWVTGKAYKLLEYANLYFLPGKSLKKYMPTHPNEEQTWALVTGSSDGIGKGFAEELCSRGINVVVHGRNETKLQRVRDDLLYKWPQRQVRILVLEAGAGAQDPKKIEEACQDLQNLNLRILINNIAGHGTAKFLWTPLMNRPASDINSFIGVNAYFPTEITRVLLPLLIRNQPSLIINIGSGASDFTCPYIDLLAGSKAYNQSWSRCLNASMKAENLDVEVLHYQVGMVSTSTSPRPTSFLCPSSRNFAKSALNVAGCGRDVIWPYWPHKLQFGLIGSMPEWLRNKIMMQIALKEKAEEFERIEGQS